MSESEYGSACNGLVPVEGPMNNMGVHAIV